MSHDVKGRAELAELDARLKTLLPPDYQETYETLQPVAMRSAGLKYNADGQVAWNDVWGSFCDLAMAGGPPHKGRLLEPATAADADATSDRYREVVDEICRGVMMAADLPADRAPVAGWVRVWCHNATMAGWLLRAITMENVAARADGKALLLPAAPVFRLEREIKNVVTVIAKTTHYWLGHMPRAQRSRIETLFATLDAAGALVVPTWTADGRRDQRDEPVFAAMTERLLRDTGSLPSHHVYGGWLGMQCQSIGAAVWMMRAVVGSNVLARREEHVLFVPVNRSIDPDGTRVCDAVARVHRLARARGVQ
jgi:hypothetical protein